MIMNDNKFSVCVWSFSVSRSWLVRWSHSPDSGIVQTSQVKSAECLEAGPRPARLAAYTLNWYIAPSVRPSTCQPVINVSASFTHLFIGWKGVIVPYRVFLRLVGRWPPSTWLSHCVSCPRNIPWSLRHQTQEASSSSGSSSGRHSSASRCHKGQREGLSGTQLKGEWSKLSLGNTSEQLPGLMLIITKNHGTHWEQPGRRWVQTPVTRRSDPARWWPGHETCRSLLWSGHWPQTCSHMQKPQLSQLSEENTFLSTAGNSVLDFGYTWSPCGVCDWPKSRLWILSHTDRCSSQSDCWALLAEPTGWGQMCLFPW